MYRAERTRPDWKWRRLISTLPLIVLVTIACARVFADHDSVEFPLPEYDDVISIPVTVGNAEHLCVLDSGCTSHIFHTSLRDTLGTQLRETDATALDGERMKLALYPVPDIKIGRITLPGSKASLQDGHLMLRASLVDDASRDRNEEPVGCVDMAIVQQTTGRNIEGVIGMPLFRKRVVQIDFDQRRVRILPATTVPSSDWGKPINVSFDEAKVPTIDVELPDEITATCIVDTGFDGAISLSSELFTKLTSTGKINPEDDRNRWQFNGVKAVHVGELANAKIGDFRNVGLRVCDGGKMNHIGRRYLRRFFVTFDLGRKQLYLKKSATFDAPDKGSDVGIEILRKNDLTIVESVERNGPGERSGIQINDELVSVGGEVIHGRPTAEIRWMYREKADANGHLVLGMRRDGVERNVNVEINR
jgi:hypothetical protein